MAGRILGHNFIHGGSGFPGLSLAVVTLLTGGETETAAAALTLEDVADLDHRETIGLLKKAELTAEETNSLTDLCLSWYQPTPTSTNHDWLFQLLLTKAVLHNGIQPIKQIRKGLKETGIWPLISARPDVHPILFPRESNVELNSQTMIETIRWPQPSCDSDEEEDEPVPLMNISAVTGFLRRFIEEASPEVLRDLMRFWVGWEQQMSCLYMKVVRSTYPVAHTCLHTLELPCHYQTYTMFHQDVMMALNSISSGFGMV
ncbi:uncharacterized protein LOC121654576 [Melanotaenia boesemani]|uniref:uncharacterized protein LOC121654576 n=1 Tax=Melanotaenia boesemani TaxID=1250792 RepID=UPI001C03FB38|nr:uncharacterized protein LOC121654576 [Melanotaenia boesemani]